MFIDRRPRGADKRLRWKAGFLVGGIALILLADRLDVPWLLWVAIGALVAAFIMRFVPERWTERRARESREPEE